MRHSRYFEVMCVFMFVCVCVCVCVRDTDIERKCVCVCKMSFCRLAAGCCYSKPPYSLHVGDLLPTLGSGSTIHLLNLTPSLDLHSSPLSPSK